MLEAHQSHELGNLASRHLGLATISYDDVTGKGASRIGFEQVAIERASEYAAEDADVTLRVRDALAPQIAASSKLEFVYRQIELPVAEILFRMERTGVLLDRNLLAVQSGELGRKMLELEQRAYQEAGQPFNLSSPKQIGDILFTQKGLPVVKKTPGGAPSTDEDTLEQLALDHPIARAILDYRGMAKLKSTYTDKLPQMINPATGRVHTSYSQATAVTGRLSSSDPNLQNIPARTAEGRRIREAFIAPPGHVLVSADYSQIELRIMAHLSDDAGLLNAFAEDRDIHTATAAEVFGVRAGRSQQRSAAHGQGHQLRPDLRHVGLRPGVATESGPFCRAGLYRPLFRPLSRRGRLHAAHPRNRARARAMSKPCSAAACICRKSTPKIRNAARAPSAPPSMRRCRAPPPTSSSWR